MWLRGGTLEREALSTAVTRLISGLKAGNSGVLFVVGEAGLGKTTILRQARKLAFPHVWSRSAKANEMERSLPFTLFTTALAGFESVRNLLEPSPTGLSGADVRAAQFCGVLRWLEETTTKPVLLTLDDLHWADPESLALLSYLVPRISGLPVVLLCALRPWPPAAYDLATALANDGYTAVEHLLPLSADASRKLLEARLGPSVDEAVLRKALEWCGGNPLFLEQITAMVHHEAVDARAQPGTIFGANKIALTCLAGLPHAAIRCAQAASVLGIRFRPALATAVAQLGDEEAYIALDALCRSGLVRTDTQIVTEFVHPLFREMLYDHLALPVRAQLHARAFRALTKQGLYEQAIDHVLRADLIGDDFAIRTMHDAGLAALRCGKLTLATRHLRTAVHLAGSRASADLLLALAESLLVSGHSDEAICVCDQLRIERDLTPVRSAQTLHILGRAFSTTGERNKSRACFAEAADLAESYDPAVAIEVLLDSALTRLMWAGPAASLAPAERACALAANATPSLFGRAVCVWGSVAFLSGNPKGLIISQKVAKELEKEIVTSLTSVPLISRILSMASLAAAVAERFNEARQILNIILPAVDRVGAVEAASGCALIQAIVAGRQGKLVEALECAERANTLINAIPGFVSPTDFIHAEVLHQMGRVTESIKWCDEIEPYATARGESYTLLRLWNIRGQRLLRDGSPNAASDLYVQLEELSHRIRFSEPCCVPWARYAITAHLRAGRVPDAHRVVRWLRRSTTQLSCRYPRIAALTGLASLAEADHDYDAAEAHFHSALALHEQVSLPLEEAETLLSCGAFLRRRGYPRRARQLLTEATKIAESHNAGWLFEQAREELAAAGGRRRRGREVTTRLTTQERRVAQLAAAGHSNKVIAAQLTLSIKTVEYHLQQIYAKLGISSRRQLMTLRNGFRHQENSEVKP